MNRLHPKVIACRLAALLVLLSSAAADVHAGSTFHVRFTPQVHEEPFTGRVYIFFSRNRSQPRVGVGWFNPELFVSQDVQDWKPGELLTFSGEGPDRLLAYPQPLSQMKLAGYRAQAVVRFNPLEGRIGTGAGNGYSQVVTARDNPGRAEAAKAHPPLFVIDKLVELRKFTETRWKKLLKVRSKLLSDFHGRDVFLQAAVRLPESYYDKPDRRYPVIFRIPGFGGTHVGGPGGPLVMAGNERGVEFLGVVLDPSCPLGHHVFADSANNGPVGAALVGELIPAFDRAFRSIAQPTARFLTGHSSGGWSSLWLQVTYADHFGGVWSTAPDPVDFRDFQRINLYRPGENMYVDADGRERPLARMRGRVAIWYRSFARMESTLGHGGQLHSFEAVFSPRGEDGTPLPLWDRETGTINTQVAKTWEKYDIRLVLERNWKTLGPKLRGKLHVFMGEADTFYLEGATILLAEALKELASDAVVEIHPGKDHGSLMTRRLLDRIRAEMVAAFLGQHPKYNRP